MARDIQPRLVPHQTDLGRIEGLDLAICYQPAMWVGGDYCDFWPLPDGRLAFAIGDVCGKGLPAAMVMANLQAALRTTMVFYADPCVAIRHVREHLRHHLPDGMFVTLVLGVFNPADGRLEYVNAGHLLPLLFAPSQPVRPLGQPNNPPLGTFETPCQTCVETVPPGVGLLVYTDGITEAMSPAGELFGQARLEGLVPASGRPAVRACSAKRVVNGITDAVSGFREDLPQQDDLTVLAMIRSG